MTSSPSARQRLWIWLVAQGFGFDSLLSCRPVVLQLQAADVWLTPGRDAEAELRRLVSGREGGPSNAKLPRTGEKAKRHFRYLSLSHVGILFSRVG